MKTMPVGLRILEQILEIQLRGELEQRAVSANDWQNDIKLRQ